MTQQLVLNFPFSHSYGIADFFISDANALAFAWLKRWPFWRKPTQKGGGIVIYGPRGCGKTHLMHAFCQMTPTYRMTTPVVAEDLNASSSWVLDDAMTWVGDHARETAFLSVVNRSMQDDKTLLLMARQPVRVWPILLPDLHSRLSAFPAVAIAQPDDALLCAVIAKLFQDRQRRIADDVITFIVSRMQRRFDVAARLVDSLDKLAAAKQQKITIPLAKTLL